MQIRLISITRWIALLAVGLAGCHKIFPFDVPAQGSPDASDGAVVLLDGPSSTTDLRWVERPLVPDTLATADQCIQTDPDCPCIDHTSRTQSQCAGKPPPDDTDCDGLKYEVGGSKQDYWPSNNNPMLLGDVFSVSPFSNWTTPTGSVNWTPTLKVAMLSGSTLTLLPLCSGVFKSPDYMVEMRVAIGKFQVVDNWAIHLWSAKDGSQQHRRCSLQETKAAPGARVVLNMLSPAGGPANVKDPNTVDIASNKTLLFQSWGDSSTDPSWHFCRVLSADGSTVLGEASTKHPYTMQPGTIQITVGGVEILVKHVRAYDH